MTNPETVSEAFIEWLENQGVAQFGVDLYSPQVPNEAPDATYWLTTSGGNVVRVLATGEKVKAYNLSLYYRSQSGKDIERKLFRLETLLNSPGCVSLTGFEVYEISASQFPTDDDLDQEDRRVGFIQVNIQIYKKGLENGIS